MDLVLSKIKIKIKKKKTLPLTLYLTMIRNALIYSNKSAVIAVDLFK